MKKHQTQREVSPSVAKLGFLVAKLREVMRSYSEGENPSRAVRAIHSDFHRVRRVGVSCVHPSLSQPPIQAAHVQSQ
jgi:hypothetical protein